MRYFDVIALIAIVVLAVYFVPDRSDKSPSPRRPVPAPRIAATAPEPSNIRPARRPDRPLAAPSRRDPVFEIQLGQKKQSTGTAFAVSNDGDFFTARHVTDGCRHLALRTGTGRATLVTNTAFHKNADLSLLKAKFRVPALPIQRAQLGYGQDGFHFGYPKGKPGAVHSQLIGRMRMRLKGRYRTSEPVLVWAHRRRIPDSGLELGGISGGPILDAQGAVVGVHVAGAKRRGRAYSVAPATMEDMARRHGVQSARQHRRADWLKTLNKDQFDKSGVILRQRLTVAKVYCLLDDRWLRKRGRRR